MSGTSLFASAIFLLCPLQDRNTRPNSPHALGPTAAAQAAVPAGLTTSDWSSIRDAYEANRHRFFATEKGWQARNPGRGWTTTADERGILMQPDGGDWTWGLELVSYGWGESQNAISVRPATSVDGVRLARIWDARLTEWYVNDRRGLEHGFIISERPKNLLAPLTLQLSIRGGLRPSISPDGRNISFVDSRGNSALNYNGLEVFDVTGRSVAAQWMKAQNDRIQLVVEDAAVPYPLTIDPIVQQAYLKASNTGGGDAFGYSVAVSGNTVVVGSPAEASNATGVNGNQANNDYGLSGAAYVFVRNGGAWSQQAYLKASNTDGLDFFGISVAISGNTIVVGAEGEASNATGVNGNQLNNSALDAGAAYVFIRSGSTWSQQAYLKASNAGQADRFGGSVAISSDTIVVGAMEEDSNAAGVNGNQANNTLTGSGAAYVFVRNHNTWTQQAYLKASNPGGNRYFGGSVAASGDTIVVGARNDSSSATGVNGNQSDTTAPSAGAAYIFFRSGSTWSQQAYLKASNTAAQDNFGYSVAASGDTVVVGAYGEDSGASGVNGNQADNSASGSGAAYVFVRSGSTWSQQAYLKASNTSAQDNFGYSVAASGDTAVVGAIGEDSGSTGVICQGTRSLAHLGDV